MDRNVSYEISLRKEHQPDCLTLLYGKEEKRRCEDTFLREEDLPDEQQTKLFFGGLAMLFAASIAIVLLLLI